MCCAIRNIAARAIARGVATYFAKRDGALVLLPPEPPPSISMTNTVDGVRLEWEAAPGADSYVVYTSPNGRSFAEGIVSAEPFLVFKPDQPLVYARVASANAAGQSLPSRLIGARVATHGVSSVLVVAGFDRLDGSMLISDDLSGYNIATVERGFVDRINDRSHVARYGEAIAAYGAAFDSTDVRSIVTDKVRMGDYDVVIWFAGESGEADEPLPAVARDALARRILDGAGKLLISGSELAWTYDNVLAGEHGAFFQSTFGVRYVGDDADSYALGSAQGIFEGLAELRFDDNGEGGYDANFPDIIEPLEGEAVLSYGGPVEGAAAVHAPNLGVIYFGFPFETIATDTARADVMERVLAAFDVEPEPDPELPDPSDDGGCGCRSGGGGGGGLAVLALIALGLAESRTRWLTKR